MIASHAMKYEINCTTSPLLIALAIGLMGISYPYWKAISIANS